MHDIRWIRENAAEFDKALNRRPLDDESKKQFSSANLLAIDERRRAAILKSEQAQARRNAASKEIGAGQGEEGRGRGAEADGRGQRAEGDAAGAGGRGEGGRGGAEQDSRDDPEPAARRSAGRQGRDTATSSIIKFGAKRDYAFKPKQHFELGEALGHDGFRDGGETVRRALRRAEGRARAAGARARAVHARCAHERARLHRGQSAAAGARRGDVRHGATAEIRGRSILAHRADDRRIERLRSNERGSIDRTGEASAIEAHVA